MVMNGRPRERDTRAPLNVRRRDLQVIELTPDERLAEEAASDAERNLGKLSAIKRELNRQYNAFRRDVYRRAKVEKRAAPLPAEMRVIGNLLKQLTEVAHATEIDRRLHKIERALKAVEQGG